VSWGVEVKGEELKEILSPTTRLIRKKKKSRRTSLPKQTEKNAQNWVMEKKKKKGSGAKRGNVVGVREGTMKGEGPAE